MKIPIKKYVMDESFSWEERYRQLEQHHEIETKFLFEKIRGLESELKFFYGPGSQTPEPSVTDEAELSEDSLGPRVAASPDV